MNKSIEGVYSVGKIESFNAIPGNPTERYYLYLTFADKLIEINK